MEFIAANGVTAIVFLIVASIVFLIVRSMIRNRALGCKGCSGGCHGCKGSCSAAPVELTDEQRDRIAARAAGGGVVR